VGTVSFWHARGFGTVTGGGGARFLASMIAVCISMGDISGRVVADEFAQVLAVGDVSRVAANEMRSVDFVDMGGLFA
jgi:hypothetical protein